MPIGHPSCRPSDAEEPAVEEIAANASVKIEAARFKKGAES